MPLQRRERRCRLCGGARFWGFVVVREREEGSEWLSYELTVFLVFPCVIFGVVKVCSEKQFLLGSLCCGVLGLVCGELCFVCLFLFFIFNGRLGLA